jgi:hypothetical protein
MAVKPARPPTTPPTSAFVLDLLDLPTTGAVVDEFSGLGLVVVAATEDEEEIVVGNAVIVTPVKTIWSNTSVGWPANDVSTVVAWILAPQLYWRYPAG